MPKLDAESIFPFGLGVVAILGVFMMLRSYSLDLDALKAFAGSCTVIGTVLFGFVSSTLAIFLSNDKSEVLKATRESKIHRERMLRFFRVALLAAFALIILSVIYTAIGSNICASDGGHEYACIVFVSAWLASFVYLLATVGRVYYFVFNMVDS